MFRPKRSNLVKRLWKCKLNQNETHGSPESHEEVELKAVAHSLLKRLKENQLESLVAVVESNGGELSDCIPLPQSVLRLGKRKVQPHILCCQLWRWPQLDYGSVLLRHLPCGGGGSAKEDGLTICCNPYHWSVVLRPESPPLSNSEDKRVLINNDDSGSHDMLPVSTETGGTPTALRLSEGESGSSSQRRPFWCNVAYWEHRLRVGRLYTVFDAYVHIFQQLPHGDGMCLGLLQSSTDLDIVRRTRDKIGLGLVLSKEEDGVWVYNRSEHPLFVNSPTLDVPNSRTLVVKKVLPGYSLKIYSYELSEVMARTRDPQFLDGPYDPNAVRISFAKGWGPSYSRQFITSCPCWIEVLLRVNR